MDDILKLTEKVAILTKELKEGNKAYLSMMRDVNKNCNAIMRKMKRAEKFIGKKQQGKMFGYYTGLDEALELFRSLFKMSELIINDNEKKE